MDSGALPNLRPHSNTCTTHALDIAFASPRYRLHPNQLPCTLVRPANNRIYDPGLHVDHSGAPISSESMVYYRRHVFNVHGGAFKASLQTTRGSFTTHRFNGSRKYTLFKPNGAYLSSLERARHYIFRSERCGFNQTPSRAPGDVVVTACRSAALFHGSARDQTFRAMESQVVADTNPTPPESHSTASTNEVWLLVQPGLCMHFRTTGRNRQRDHDAGRRQVPAPIQVLLLTFD